MTAPALAVPTEHGRFYVHPTTQARVPSITNILGKKFKPLYNSGLRAAADYAADNLPRLASLDRDEIYRLVSNPPRPEWSPSAIGDLVHKWVEETIVTGKTPPQEDLNAAPNTARWMFERFLLFRQQYSPQFTATEFTVWSTKYGYAGTADWSAMLNGWHVLADTKTGKNVYPETAMQLAAIQNADFVLDANGNQLPVPKYDRYAVLHLRPRSFTLYPVQNIDKAFQCFLALKHVFDWDLLHGPSSIAFAPKHN